ncbi:two-component system response regulator [Geomesophilobacter sediminis]|uniref:Diguanylate cyclase n=1 Tax=Geomesophilobacter sediminis TaxID=2798584 RepID=A0A8J7M392_9BACT|nr:diguanylate cyclase [Geomesophilobacter sediminis]MBJ6727910.1 diguanylate cyclase [Geomesophilobacter sediminis]
MDRTHDQEFLKTLTVLYVEDDEDVRRQLEVFLKRRVGKVIPAGNGTQGVAAFRAHQIDLVVTDILMPEMNGLEMVRQIRELDGNVPVIVTTAFEQTEYLLDSIDLGVNGYVVKPIGTEKLSNRLLECAHRLYLEEQQRLAATVYRCSPEAILVTDRSNRIVSVNDAFCRITGYAADEVIGKNPHLLSSGEQEPSFYQAMWEEISTKRSWQGELVNRRQDGTHFPARLSITCVNDPAGEITHHVGILSDITERKRAEEQIRHLAMHDALTGLPNRSLLTARFELALAAAQRYGRQLAILFIDLDNFKAINDHLGHQAGDLVLQEIGQRLLGLVRASDTVSRLGGDEFIIVINGVREEVDAIRTAEKVVDTVRSEFVVDAVRVQVSPSIGVALYPRDGSTMETLIRQADAAMYRHKQEKRESLICADSPFDSLG